MKVRNLLTCLTPVILLLALFAMVRPAFAEALPPDGLCGKSGIVVGANGLTVKKDVDCTYKRSWSWEILKSVDFAFLTLSTGQTFPVNYTVTVNASSANVGFQVSGTIGVQNTTSQPIIISSIVDTLGPVSCGVTFPYSLPAGRILICTYGGTLASAASQNSAIVTDGNAFVVTAVAPIDWSKGFNGEEDECADVNDSYAGHLGIVCANESSKTFTFNYSQQIGPYAVCGEYNVDNTASFITNDTGSTSSASQTVNVKVPCAGGCSLTPGYWKTHSIFGPAPYDDTWAQIGENIPFFYSSNSYYAVLWTSPAGNAYYILAHAYIAAQLNQINGADFSAAQAAFDQATLLLNNPTNTPSYVGSLRGSSSLRQQFISLATILDNYNNGLIGPGHCSE
jgi:hypothetical protein